MKLPALPAIVIDTREQAPFVFEWLTCRRALASGDYSLLGHESQIAIERKSIPDLYGSIGRGRRRFQAEIARLSRLRVAAVVVEGDWAAIAAWRREGNVGSLDPKIIFRTVISWQQRYPRVHWWICPDRRFAELATLRILECYWRQLYERQAGNGRNHIPAPRNVAGQTE